MIKFTLKCDKDHHFESWFQSSDAFDKLKSAGMIVCAECGSTNVSKSLMAPRVRPARTSASKPNEQDQKPDLKSPASDQEKALADMRKHVEENSDYVGMNFAKEARKIHDGDSPERAIYGEAKPEEAVKLIEDGVPVAPLPFVPKRKTN